MSGGTFEVKCPGCGHLLPISFTVSSPRRKTAGDLEVIVTVDDELDARIQRHVDLHPELHSRGM